MDIPIGSGEIIMKYNGLSKTYFVLYSNLPDKGISSFKVAVSKDGGNTWIPSGKVDTQNMEHAKLKIKFSTSSYYVKYNAFKLYDFQGSASALKVYETEVYSASWWD